ncbi:MAG: hypothetical protein GX681_07465, partial [Clostridiaceae bacterium]|nr:hypothetical protein [Clostridiaceae bacterium]
MENIIAEAKQPDGASLTPDKGSFAMTESKLMTHRNFKIMLVLLGIALLFLLCACDPTEFLAGDHDPAKSGNETLPGGTEDDSIDALALIRDRKFSELYPYFTAASRSRYKLADIIARQEQIDERIGLQSMQFENVRKLDRASDDRITVYEMSVVMQTSYGEMSRPLTLTYLYDEHAEHWYLEYSAALIFPGLTDDNDLIVERLTAPRGGIYDRNNIPLAVDGKGQIVGAISGLYDTADNAEVAELLGLSVDQVDAIMSQSWIGDNMYVPIKTQMEFSAGQLKKLSDLHLEMRLFDTRLYPHANSAAHLVGHVGEVSKEELENDTSGIYRERDMIGKRGLESLFEDELRAKRGVRVYLSGSEKQILYEIPAEAGKDFHLTLDIELQDKLYSLFKEDEGQVVCLDPLNGDILALLSFPSFDPNEFVQGIASASYQALLDDSRLPLWNKFQASYTPGSTMKIPTAMAGFKAGTLSPATTKTIIGKNWQPDASWGSYKIARFTVDDSPQDLSRAIVISDNIYFAQVALEMGKDVFQEQLLNLGFTEDVPSSYPFASAQFANSGTIGDTVMLATSAYGQGEIKVSSTQMACIYAAIAAKGDIPAPRLLLSDEAAIWKEAVISDSNRVFLQ